MATLNNPNAERIISAAYRKLNVLPSGYTYNPNQLLAGEIALNALTKEFQALGMSAYLISSVQINMAAGVGSYFIGELLNATPFPTYIYKANLLQPGTSQIEMTQYSVSDFSSLPYNSTGVPVGFLYLVGKTSAVLQVWPTPDASVPTGTTVELVYQRPMDIILGPTDAVDFPAEWETPLVYHLAVLLADEVGAPEQKKAWLEKQADKHLALVLGSTNEQGSVFVQPDWQWRYNN